MYLDRFGLERPPFEETTSPRFCYQTAAVSAICEAVMHHLRSGSGIILVEGQSGAGRTMLGRVLAERVPNDVRPLAVIPAPSGAISLLSRIGATLQLTDFDGESPAALVAAMCAADQHQEQQHYAVIVDDAEQLSVAEFAYIEGLLAAAVPANLKLTCILLATEAVHSTLRLPELAKLAAQIRHTPQINHLHSHETGAYLDARLAAAGWREGALFTSEAVERISRIARGRMRQINALARQALIRADRLGLAQIDAEQIPEPAGETSQPACAPARASRSEQSMDSQKHVGASDLERMERILERYAEIASTAPQRLAELDAGLTRLGERAETIVRSAAQRVEQLEDFCTRAGTSETAINEQLPHIERLTGEAKRVQHRLDEFVRRLGDIDGASEERIALLLSGLESATAIHDKLESAGQHVTALIDEARQTAIAERENLVKVFEDLSLRREELSATIDSLRHQRQAALEENEVAVGQMVLRCRADAAQACATSAEALAEARRTADANRAAMAEQAGAANRKLVDARNACAGILDQVQHAQADIDARHAALMQNSTRFDERIAALAEASEKSAKLTASAQQAADRLGDTLAQSKNASDALGRNIDMAAHLRDNCVATLERLQADGVHTLEQVSASADQRLGDAIGRFETLIATELRARAAADEAIRTARTALATVQQSETKLAEAQAAAINIEATASAALTTVQQQVKRFDDSIDVIVKHGLERARSEIIAVIDSGNKRFDESAKALDQAVETAIKRVRAEIAATLSHMNNEQQRVDVAIATSTESAIERVAAKEHEAASAIEASAAAGRLVMEQDVAQCTAAIQISATNALARAEAAFSAGRTDIEREVSMATEAVRAACTNAVTQSGAVVSAGLSDISREMDMATDAVRSTCSEALAQSDAAVAAGREVISREVEMATKALRAACSNAISQSDAAVSAGREVIDREVAVATEAVRKTCSDAVSQSDAAVATGREVIDREVTVATEAVRATCSDAVSQSNSAVATGREVIDREVAMATEAVHAACNNAVSQSDAVTANGLAALEAASTQVKSQTAKHAHDLITATEAQLSRRHAETCELAAETTHRLDTELALFAASARSAIEQMADEKNRMLQQTAASTEAGTCERIASAASGALQTIEGELGSAQDATNKLAALNEEARRVILEVGVTREQIDHQIRDVWSLTATTDQRVREIAAITDQAADREKHLGELLAAGVRQSNALGAQAEAVRKSTAMLTAQHEQIKGICATFAERIAEAHAVCHDVAEANTVGQLLAPEMRSRAEEIQALLAAATTTVEQIRGDSEAARSNHATVQQLSGATVALERKLIQFQEALANPMTVIQEARGQADELNEICLAVKRVFRGVSQASLQANERIKMLGKLLMATERSAHTMKQWVEEAGRAQTRLADTLSISPRIQDTHPIIALPGEFPMPAAPLERGVHITASDGATLRRLSATRPANRVPVANESAQPRPVAVPVGKEGSVAKAVVPLVDVLKARQAKTQQPGGKRLSPAEVQSMIDAARQPAPTGP